MIFRQFFEPQLAQFSYLIGCSTSGEAIVVDPVRHIDQYIKAAEAEGLHLSAVTETHIHADFASGALALARHSSANLYVSGEGGPEWQYAFANHPGVRALRNRDVFHVGKLRFDVVHAPGHTPEHLVFVIADEAVSAHPLSALTGDFLFAGDVGRPDLLEKTLGNAGSADTSARALYASVRAFAVRPDWLLVWPGHGAGSACGKNLGSVPVTSLGYEKLTNWAFAARDERRFVSAVLADQPEPPRYFAEMKRLNRRGAPAWRAPNLRRVGAPDLADLEMVQSTFVDLRPDATTSGFLPGSVALPLTRQFLTWAGSVLRYGMPLYIVSADQQEARAAAAALALIGIDDVRAWVPAEVLDEYRRGGGVLEQLADRDPASALQRHGDGHVLLDVRTSAEWNRGRLPDAVHAPLAQLIDRVSQLDRDTPVVVYCQAGARSRIAATVLRRIGFTRVSNLAGGYLACETKRPTEPRNTDHAPVA